MEDLPHISPQKPLGRSLPSASVQGANVQPKQSYLFPPCCVPSGPSHNLTKEAAVNVLENPITHLFMQPEDFCVPLKVHVLKLWRVLL